MSATRAEPVPITDTSAHILIVDDDRRIRDLLRRYLSTNGFRVSVAASGADARANLKGLVFDLVILDVMMPGETGFELLASLRLGEQVPVLMLTARSDADDRIKGLELGAADYLPKPFEPRELLLRITNIMKRNQPPPAPAKPELVRFGPFVFVLDRGELRQGEEVVRLTERERDLLRALASQPGETVSRYDLVGAEGDTSERAVDVQINRLRRKIERDAANPIHLQTVRGVGYRLVTS